MPAVTLQELVHAGPLFISAGRKPLRMLQFSFFPPRIHKERGALDDEKRKTKTQNVAGQQPRKLGWQSSGHDRSRLVWVFSRSLGKGTHSRGLRGADQLLHKGRVTGRPTGKANYGLIASPPAWAAPLAGDRADIDRDPAGSWPADAAVELQAFLYLGSLGYQGRWYVRGSGMLVSVLASLGLVVGNAQAGAWELTRWLARRAPPE